MKDLISGRNACNLEETGHGHRARKIGIMFSVSTTRIMALIDPIASSGQSYELVSDFEVVSSVE